MSHVCMISGKRFNGANNVSHSHVRTKRRQQPNLQWKRFVTQDGRTVRLRVATSVMKTIDRYGLEDTIKRYGADPALLKG